MISDDTIRSYADWEHGLIIPHLFSSQELYELELERLFSKTWLFLAHESQFKKTGDFFTTWEPTPSSWCANLMGPSERS